MHGSLCALLVALSGNGGGTSSALPLAGYVLLGGCCGPCWPGRNMEGGGQGGPAGPEQRERAPYWGCNVWEVFEESDPGAITARKGSASNQGPAPLSLVDGHRRVLDSVYWAHMASQGGGRYPPGPPPTNHTKGVGGSLRPWGGGLSSFENPMCQCKNMQRQKASGAPEHRLSIVARAGVLPATPLETCFQKNAKKCNVYV